ncbi:MAG: hypothetical protein M3O55_02680 [Actinomycetota bacterium]|nr:hypothetical protein [Actinomycetota bacterium]
MTDFLPSAHGFAFDNAWPSQPVVEMNTAMGRLNLGDARGGLCGGMVFAALDYWNAGIVPPSAQPAKGDPLYAFIVKRLIDSWHLPVGIAQYYQWMNLPDADTGFTAFGRRVVIDRGLAWRTIRLQLPAIRHDLDRGTPVPLGVVTTSSARPGDLGANHQVLAHGCEVTPTAVSVHVYDPNSGQRDDVSIDFDPRSPTKKTTFAHNLAVDHPVRGFFRTSYSPAALPAVG